MPDLNVEVIGSDMHLYVCWSLGSVLYHLNDGLVDGRQ